MFEKPEVLAAAVARNSAAVISLPSAGMLRNHRSRFLSRTSDGIWVESVPEDRLLVDTLIAAKAPMGVSFKAGVKRITFIQSPEKREPSFSVNAQTIVEALFLRFPKDLRVIQRRADYRVRVAEDSHLRVRIWRVAEHAYIKDQPPSGQELSVSIRDISAGGLAVALHPKKGEAPKVLENERLRVLLSFGSEEMILEARLRYRTVSARSGAICGGGQFTKLENNIEGRRSLAALTRIVAALQREEIRRKRLSMSA